MELGTSLQEIGNFGNISIIVIIFSALLYYFGVLVADVQVQRYDKAHTYIEGLFFSINYIIAPFILILLIIESLKLYLPFLIALILQMFILILLWLNSVSNEFLRKYGFSSKFKDVLEKEAIKRSKIFLQVNQQILSNVIQWYNSLIYSIIPKYIGNRNTLFFFSFIVIYSIFSNNPLKTDLSPPSIFLSVLSFLNLTFLALSHGYSKVRYPNVKIVTEDGKEIVGRLLKFEEFTCLFKEKEEEKIFINKDKIVKIEVFSEGREHASF